MFFPISHHRDGGQERGGDPGSEPLLAVVVLLLPIGLLPEAVDDAQLLAATPAAVGLIDELASTAAASEATSVVAEIPDRKNK